MSMLEATKENVKSTEHLLPELLTVYAQVGKLRAFRSKVASAIVKEKGKRKKKGQ